MIQRWICSQTGSLHRKQCGQVADLHPGYILTLAASQLAQGKGWCINQSSACRCFSPCPPIVKLGLCLQWWLRLLHTSPACLPAACLLSLPCSGMHLLQKSICRCSCTYGSYGITRTSNDPEWMWRIWPWNFSGCHLLGKLQSSLAIDSPAEHADWC